MMYLIRLFIFINFFYTPSIVAQSLVEDANLSLPLQSGEQVFYETIKIISNSKKIFIITNNNQQLGPGDFISLALDNKLAARAVVAKSHQGQTGIKILKIYSLSQWARLKRNLDVQIIKGDDSFFNKTVIESSKDKKKVDEPRIKSEEDLYSSDITADEELGLLDENKLRHIKPDNVVGIFGAFLDASEVESRGGTVRANEFGVSWAYQFSDNYFFEALYGRALFNNFPADGTQTLANHFTGRFKFNIKGPLYTFLMPYVGFHTYSISSPDAGKSNNEMTNNEELDAIEKLKKSGPVIGATILRRLVPGWFVKADIGTDVINLGFAIEF